MSDGIVTDGNIGALATVLTRRLGRRTVVHRSEQRFKKPGQTKLTLNIRYSLGIQGCQPDVWFGMTANEVKLRMAMLVDLLVSGVVIPVHKIDAEKPDDIRESPKTEGSNDEPY